MSRRLLLPLSLLALLLTASPAIACPFCNAVSQTLRQEMAAMDAVVIATAVDGDQTRNQDTGQVRMKIERVLKGEELVETGQVVDAVYYGDVSSGRRFMLSGVDPPEMQWSCLPVSKRAEQYVVTVTELPDDPVKRLQFYHDYLQDEESMLSRDAYDEFAIAPYDAVQQLEPSMDHDQLVAWIQDKDMSTDRKRLYLTMLGVCGTEEDVPMLEKMLRSSEKSTRSGLDALIGCYLTLAGEDGLEVVDELFLNNKQAPYADTYAAIMALRFHGTEGDVIPRSALVESLHHVLERKDLADLVIPDLARWGDWSQIDRLTELFLEADADNNWVRVPVVNYLRACPLPEADEALKKLKEADPESVRRANTFFSVPKPAGDQQPSTSALPAESDHQFAAATPPLRRPTLADGSEGPAAGGSLTAGTTDQSAPADRLASVNPWRLSGVLGMSLASVMIGQFLLLSGGPQTAGAA